MSTPTRKDWLLWGCAGFALAATYHAEYTLAVAAHFNEYVALAVPGALDLYVLRALQQRRDVFLAVLAMVAANVASHLIAGEVLRVGWPVISAVGAIAPLVLWRVYSLKHTRTRQELLMGVEAGAVSAPAHPVAPAHESWCGLTHPDGGECSEYGYPPTPDTIPSWMDEEYPLSAPVPYEKGAPMNVETPWAAVRGAEEYEWKVTSTSELPPLPPEYAPGVPEYPMPTEEEWEALTAADREYLGEANEYVHSSASHTLAGLRAALGIGQARATRLIKHLKSEGVW